MSFKQTNKQTIRKQNREQASDLTWLISALVDLISQDPHAEVCTLTPRMKQNPNRDGKASCLALGFPEPVLSGLHCLGFHRCSRHFVSLLLALASHRHRYLTGQRTLVGLNHCCVVSQHCRSTNTDNASGQVPSHERLPHCTPSITRSE